MTHVSAQPRTCRSSLRAAGMGILCCGLLLQASCAARGRRDMATLPERHRERVMSVAWSPDGTRLASGGFDATVIIWDAAGGKAVRALRTSSPAVLDVQWSADGTRLASTSSEAVELFDDATGARLASIDTAIGAKAAARFAPGGALMALATYDGRILVVDGADGRERAILHGHRGEVSSLAWSPDGRTLLSGAWDYTVRLWDVETLRQTSALEAAGVGALQVRWSGDGRFASWHVSVTRDFTFYEVATGARTRVETGPVAASAWRPGEDALAIGTAGGTVEIRRAGSSVPEVRFTCGTFADTLAWSPNGRFLAVVPFMSKHVCVWDGARAVMIELHVSSEPLIAVAWSPAGDRLAVAGYDGYVRLLAFTP